MTRAALVAVVLALIPAPRAAAADVLTVGPSGDYPDLQSAVAAAADFDVILVSSGTYDGVLRITDKALTVVADVGEEVVLNGPVIVESLAAGKHVALIGLALTNEAAPGVLEPFAHQHPVLLLANNAGAVRFEDGSITANTSDDHRPGSALEVVACADVAVARSEIFGGLDADPFSVFVDPASIAPPPAVFVRDSTLVVHGGSIRGADSDLFFSDPSDGGAALRVARGEVFLAGVSVRGGAGSQGAPECVLPTGHTDSVFPGNGGAGLQLLGPAAAVRRLGGEVLGGAGGVVPDGGPYCFGLAPGDPGPAFDLADGRLLTVRGEARGFHLQNPAREQEPVPAMVTGQPGDLVGVFWGYAPDTLFKWGLRGHALLDFGLPSTRFFLLGALPQSGRLEPTLVFDELTPGVDGITLYFQLAARSANGATFLAAPVTTVILDESL